MAKHRDIPGIRLVLGSWLPLPGGVAAHGWVEIGDIVYETITSQFVDKADYYALMGNQALRLYTAAGVIRLLGFTDWREAVKAGQEQQLLATMQDRVIASCALAWRDHLQARQAELDRERDAAGGVEGTRGG